VRVVPTALRASARLAIAFLLAAAPLLAGCASPPPAPFVLDAAAAAREARSRGAPLVVLSVVGELDGRL